MAKLSFRHNGNHIFLYSLYVKPDFRRKGIGRKSVEQFDKMLSGEEFNYEYYGIYNGLPGISTSNSYSALTEDGYLFMAGTSTVTKVNIEDSFENVSELKAAVPFVEADGVYIYPDDNGNFTVPANTQKLTIYGYVFNYALVNPNVTYQLKGFDTQSVTVPRSDLKPVDYTNLAGGKYYCHINPNGDVEPCVFIHYSNANIHEKSLLECLKQPLFRAYQYNQPFNDNLLRPCPMLENPLMLRKMVAETGAHSTDLTNPESCEHLCSKCDHYADVWQPMADLLWEKSYSPASKG